MKTGKEIRAAIKQCGQAQQKDDPSKCPLWPNDDTLYCIDCTARSAWRWVLEIKED